MSTAVYPSNLPGETYPIIKRATFDTLMQTSQSGREVRLANYAAPIYEWEIPYSFVENDAGAGGAFSFTFQALLSFFVARYGQFDSFRYLDPEDNTATDTQFGIGTGTQTQFQIGRDLGGGVVEPLTDVTSVIVKVSGAVVTPASISATGLVTFSVAPGVGAPITGTFSFWYRVRFNDDKLEFENFVQHFFAVKKVALRQVRV